MFYRRLVCVLITKEPSNYIPLQALCPMSAFVDANYFSCLQLQKASCCKTHHLNHLWQAVFGHPGYEVIITAGKDVRKGPFSVFRATWRHRHDAVRTPRSLPSLLSNVIILGRYTLKLHLDYGAHTRIVEGYELIWTTWKFGPPGDLDHTRLQSPPLSLTSWRNCGYKEAIPISCMFTSTLAYA